MPSLGSDLVAGTARNVNYEEVKATTSVLLLPFGYMDVRKTKPWAS